MPQNYGDVGAYWNKDQFQIEWSHCGQFGSGACDLFNVQSRASLDAPHKTFSIFFWFTAAHIEGKSNTCADALSRNNSKSVSITDVSNSSRSIGGFSSTGELNTTWMSMSWFKITCHHFSSLYP